MFLHLIGFGASILSTVAFLPQAVYIIRTRDTRSISLTTYLISVTAAALWFIYGIMLRDVPIIFSNVICLVLTGIILVFKLHEKTSDFRKKIQ